MKEIAAAINDFIADDIATLESQGNYDLTLSDQTITISLEDVEISSQDIPGWVVASEGKITVALDIEITDELREEGIARDLVTRIKYMRKDMGLEVQDKIDLSFGKADPQINTALNRFSEYICIETQANSLVVNEDMQEGSDLEIDKYKLKLKIEA